MKLEENVSLLPYNTFGIKANARYFARYPSVQSLQNILKTACTQGLQNNILPIGIGSNLLFVNNFDGLALVSNIDFIKETKQEQDVLLEVGSGVDWDCFVAYCVSKNYYGAENLSLIPGTVGASAIQNIGAYGAEAKDIIEKVNCIEIKTQKEFCFAQADLEYGYRTSKFKTAWKNKFIVTSVVYKLSTLPQFNIEYKGLQEEMDKLDNTCHLDNKLQRVRTAIINIRQSKLPDPKVQGNAGSYFMNPVISASKFARLQKQHNNIPHYSLANGNEKIPAAWLIEQCGWKGKQLGNVATHAIQPLVLVNVSNATGHEIVQLANKIIETVKEKFEIILQPEVIYIY